MGSYKALYRKYRPQTFEEVVDQGYVTKTLINAINSNRISHAYLFNGPRGIGKTSIARIFAKAINCEHRNGAEPCCECEICKSIVDGSNPDIIEIDAASRTKVEQMRDTLEKVSFLPTICKYKVYIIDEVHMLSTNSFNALLKTLEEPPAHVIFILCTTEVEKVIPTIRSRCQRFDFHLISKEAMEERLRYIANEEGINIEDDAISLIAEASEGGMRDALSLLDQISSFSVNETITADDVLQVSGELSTETLIDIASSINNNDSSRAISSLDELIRNGKDVEKITQGLITFFKDILVIKNVGREIKKVGYSRFDFKALSDALTNAKVFKFIDTLTQAMSDYRFSTNKRLYLELSIIKMCDREIGVIPKSTLVTNPNASTRTPYDPNVVYGKPQADIIPKKEEKPAPIQESKKEKPAEAPEPVKEKAPEPIKDDLNSLLDAFGSVLSVEPEKQEIKEKIIKEEKEEYAENVSVINSFEAEPPASLNTAQEEKPEEAAPEANKPDSVEKNEDDENSNDNKEYDIHVIEEILNYPDKPYKESIISKLAEAERDSKGTPLHRYALLLDGGNIVASNKKQFIMTFEEVGHCNLISKPENHEGVMALIKEITGDDLDFIALPFSLWKALSDDFINQYKANRQSGEKKYFSLTYVPCPELKSYSSHAPKEKENKEEDERYKELEDIFGDILTVK